MDGISRIDRSWKKVLNLSLLCVLVLASTACTRRKEIWIYTSLPKEVISEMVEPLQAAVPRADVKWFQGGSETVANRMDEEKLKEQVKADLVVTGDPLWYQEMKDQGIFLPYDSPAAKAVPAQFKDPDQMFVAVRIPVTVIAYNVDALKQGEVPEHWKDLTSPRFERKVSMGTPLDASPSFVALSMLSGLYGWDFFAGLRKAGLVAEGAASSVLTRIESGERPVGILPLDLVLRTGALNRSVRVVYPQDGVIPVPGSIAILKETAYPDVAHQVYDWFFSDTAQAALARGGNYSSLPTGPTPTGALPWAAIQNKLLPWSPQALKDMYKTQERTRAKFSEVVLH